MTTAVLDIAAIRADFPILSRQVHGRPLVYLDNAATTQKPRQVIDALVDYYSNTNANIHRGLHTLAEEATAAYELTRQKDRRFHRRGQSARGCLYAQHDRVAQPARLHARGAPAPRRRDHPLGA